MSYIGRDELHDTISENVRPLHSEIGKLHDILDRQIESLESRVQRDIAAAAQKASNIVPFNRDFQRLQEEVDEMREVVKSVAKLAKLNSQNIAALYEEMQLIGE